MRKKVMIGAIAAIWGIGLNNVQAQVSDVWVDLSVLDSLSPTVSSELSSQPLFPVVKKSVKKTSAVKKKVKSRKKAEKVRKAPKVQVVKKETVSIPAENAAPVAAPMIETSAKTEAVTENLTESPAPVAAVEKEPVAAPVSDSALTVTENVAGSAEPTSNVSEKPDGLQTNNLIKDAEPVADNVENEKIVVVDVEPASPVQAVDIEPVKTPETPAAEESNLLTFADDVSELTAEQQRQIDAIIASFENPQHNKIGILSYNLNNGVDAFKRKRQSLNRAVEVRSYLLPKGFKNFSIKVVNIDEGSTKANSVEIIELK